MKVARSMLSISVLVLVCIFLLHAPGIASQEKSGNARDNAIENKMAKDSSNCPKPLSENPLVAFKKCGNTTCCDDCHCCWNNNTGEGYCCGPNTRCGDSGGCH